VPESPPENPDDRAAMLNATRDQAWAGLRQYHGLIQEMALHGPDMDNELERAVLKKVLATVNAELYGRRCGDVC